MKVYVVTTAEMDDIGNIFHDFHGVFKTKLEAEQRKKELDTTYKDDYGELKTIERAEIYEYEL